MASEENRRLLQKKIGVRRLLQKKIGDCFNLGRDKTLGDFFTATAGARCTQAGPDTTFIQKKERK